MLNLTAYPLDIHTVNCLNYVFDSSKQILAFVTFKEFYLRI